MKYQNPVIVIPGITGTSLTDEYPINPEAIWSTLLDKNFERLALHPDNLRYEAREPARVVRGQVCIEVNFSWNQTAAEVPLVLVPSSFDRRVGV